MINAWWVGEKSENYWLEVTDRIDLGTNLKAPQTDQSGKDFWSYTLLKYVKPNDIVFHYDKKTQAICAKSVATGEVWADDIVWAAKGTVSRNAGIQPYSRPGWFLGLEQFTLLDHPISLDEIREKQDWLSRRLTYLRNSVGKSPYFPFEMGTRRALRPMQGYLFKLPAFFLDSFPSLTQKTPLAPSKYIREGLFQLGEEYRLADEQNSIAERDPHSVDPAIVERSLFGHASTQNSLAKYLEEHGVSPRSPHSEEPNYDLGWEYKGVIWIAEIKSITDSNEEKQLRLGLGQLLRYLHLLKRRRIVRGVLVPELRPQDVSWDSLCKELGIILAWPKSWSKTIKID